jgi:hypothetical protein
MFVPKIDMKLPNIPISVKYKPPSLERFAGSDGRLPFDAFPLEGAAPQWRAATWRARRGPWAPHGMVMVDPMIWLYPVWKVKYGVSLY